MYRLLTVALISISLILTYGQKYNTAAADPSPAQLCSAGYPKPCQSRSDTFTFNGESLDKYNPLSKKVRETGVVRWAYKVESGCHPGNMSTNIGAAMGDLFYNTGVVSVYVTDGSQDLTIRANCGTSFQAVCGGGSIIGCLGRGFPYNLDIDLSDRMADFYDLSQISIVAHEYSGHALATFNEQYLEGFGSNPGFIDQMNTGPESRVLFGDSAMLPRWGRVMGAPAPTSYGFNAPGQFLWVCGISDKATGIWIEGLGAASFRDIPRQADGCYGFMANGPCVTFDIGNAVDWKRIELRSDRTVCA